MSKLPETGNIDACSWWAGGRLVVQESYKRVQKA